MNYSPKQQNYVAKYARRFNRADVFRDRTKYKRKAKNKRVSYE